MQGNLTFTSSSSQTKLLFQTHQKQSGCRLNQFPANCTSFAMTTVSLSATGTPTQPTVALQKNQKPNILLSQIICLQHIKANSHGQFFLFTCPTLLDSKTDILTRISCPAREQIIWTVASNPRFDRSYMFVSIRLSWHMKCLGFRTCEVGPHTQICLCSGGEASL